MTRSVFSACLLVLGISTIAQAQTPATTTTPAQTTTTSTTGKPTIEIYGFGQADAIVDFNTNNPDWYDVMRPSKLPAFRNEFGRDGHFYLSPRQSRFGVKGELPTDKGPVKAVFEFDMFGVGADAGLTTIRLRHAWGQWRKVGAGQTNSQFMDVDVFPNILDYWGPNGMLFFRNTQVFYEPYVNGDSNIRVAIENPGASGDAGRVADRIELSNIFARFPAPDLTGHYRMGRSWGYVQVGGALRYMVHDDLFEDRFDLTGHNWGWGVSISSNVKPTSNDVLRLQYIFGRGVENYFNDAPVDVGAETNPGNARTPIVGEALRDIGIVAYLDHTWNSRWASAAGYSSVNIDNSDLQLPAAFHKGQYASANLLWTPVTNVMMGGELQWLRRENFSDGFESSDRRLQFSFKYSFSAKLTGE
ncbi:MAG TPA: DcaP family trimeric outer membrane transporter [Vicinamibacterales bacterium]|nr:DcaP family trimeric outer membrane transporter [Vicinamibacterales bacterium]